MSWTLLKQAQEVAQYRVIEKNLKSYERSWSLANFSLFHLKHFMDIQYISMKIPSDYLQVV